MKHTRVWVAAIFVSLAVLFLLSSVQAHRTCEATEKIRGVIISLVDAGHRANLAAAHTDEERAELARIYRAAVSRIDGIEC